MVNLLLTLLLASNAVPATPGTGAATVADARATIMQPVRVTAIGVQSRQASSTPRWQWVPSRDPAITRVVAFE